MKKTLLTVALLSSIIPATANAELYIDNQGNHQFKNSHNGDNVTISSGRDVYYNGTYLTKCPTNYDSTQTFNGGITISCEPDEINVMAGGAVYTLSSYDMNMVYQGNVENKEISAARGGSTHVTISAAPQNYDYNVVVKNLGVQRHQDHVVVDLGSDILFDFDSASLRPEARESLNQLAFVINKDRKGLVIIRGHTDSKGSDSYNLNLSDKRAMSVANWLMASGGVSNTVLRTQGLGENYPKAHNTYPNGSDNPDGRAQNRRVEIIVQTVENAAIPEPTTTIITNGVAAGVNGAIIGAQGAAIGAQGAAIGAQGAVIGVEGAHQGAEAARAGAQRARDDAQAARDAAEALRNALGQ